MLTSFHLHKKSSEVSIKTRSTPALLSIQARTLSTQLKNGLFHLCNYISNLGTAALTKEHRILYLKFHCATYLGNHDSEELRTSSTRDNYSTRRHIFQFVHFEIKKMLVSFKNFRDRSRIFKIRTSKEKLKFVLNRHT